ncbi:uncharacterized protein LOC126108925 isoform X2 [Schistocerca cancellata]|uniref:uncharacterized protein LOC126108925 isoform X2 n=1 Tax=Schistocerca cancellata TaxID=274614 RepID=UPI00211907CF|nr:uncharacterized protein LOC126108925 isoform X2 [Schistocerca cancellata]
MLQSVQFSQPPPPMPNLSIPPPNFPPPQQPPPQQQQLRYGTDPRGVHRGHFFQPFRPYTRPGPVGADSEFDGKRLRKSVMRKTVDYNSAIIKMLESRVWQRDFRDRRSLQPDVLYYPDLQPPPAYADNPINSVTTRFVKTATNKMRCPIFCMAWTPEGRRLVTGASSGEFTLWNGLTFNFETILQAHDSPVRTMVWSHNDVWMVTGDHAGYVKYWQSNMNNVKMFQAHKEAIRGLSFSPTDHKFVTCSDDGTLRIWDFMRCHEERILRGHGADVKCVHWHPQKGLIISGSKDNQQPVKLWDPKTGQSLATLHAHKSTVMDIKWNANGNWLVTASRDHLLKLFDLRNLSTEVQTFRGHKKEASSVAWHPYHEGLFCSGGSDGAILFWHVGADKEVGGIEQAHDSIVWTLAWHPLGHILCSGSNDHTSKFWTRNRPGDQMRDKYNLNTLPAGLTGVDDQDVDEPAVIPGMGPEDKVETTDGTTPAPAAASQIPGLDFEGVEDRHRQLHKKVPYSKPIPRNFQAQWNETKLNHEDGMDEDSDGEEGWRNRRGGSAKDPISEVISQIMETNPPPGVVPLSQLQPQAILIYGKLIPVEGNPVLLEAIQQGGEALRRLIDSGEIEELQDVMPHNDDSPALGGNARGSNTVSAAVVTPRAHPRKPEYREPVADRSVNDSDRDETSNDSYRMDTDPHNNTRHHDQLPMPGTRQRRTRFSDLPAPDLSNDDSQQQMQRPQDHEIEELPHQDKDMRQTPLSHPHQHQIPYSTSAPMQNMSDQDMRFPAGPPTLLPTPGSGRDVDLRSTDLYSDLPPPLMSSPMSGMLSTTGDSDLRRMPLLPSAGLPPVRGMDEDLRVPPHADRYRDVGPVEDHDMRQQWAPSGGGGPAPVPGGPRKRRWGADNGSDDGRPSTPQPYLQRSSSGSVRTYDRDQRGRSPILPDYEPYGRAEYRRGGIGSGKLPPPRYRDEGYDGYPGSPSEGGEDVGPEGDAGHDWPPPTGGPRVAGGGLLPHPYPRPRDSTSSGADLGSGGYRGRSPNSYRGDTRGGGRGGGRGGRYSSRGRGSMRGGAGKRGGGGF